MVIKRCDMCFQDKSGLMPIIPGCKAVVCKACGYKVNQVSGFLEYHGISLRYTMDVDGRTSDTDKKPKEKEKQ